MSIFDDEPRGTVQHHQIGQELGLLSVDELHKRIKALEVEIERLKTEVEQKGQTKSAAEALFRRT